MFNDLAGNEPVKQTLRGLIAAGRVPNSLLFAGPDGVGKRAFAFELARAFMCLSPVNGEGCGNCSSCGRVDAFAIPEPTDKSKDDFKRVFFGEHADVGMAVSYKRFILIEAVRDLERAAHFSPYEARARFFVIDNADRMNASASNALLKTLEEPPETSYIVLVTARPDSLLTTIRSRCQTIRFAPVAAAEIESVVRAKRGLAPDDARLAAAVARGSIGSAMSLDLSDFRTRREMMLGVLESILDRRDLAGALRTAEKMNDAKNKDHYEDSLDILEYLIRDIWLLDNGTGREGLTNADLAEKLAALSPKASSPAYAGWLAEIDLLRQSLAVNINRKIATDALFAEMAG
jgi:DNA polymerase-3 subunit delta'